MSVKFLPKEIRSRIRSGIAINTLVDCVEALVQNAIDANANCVAVRIDLPFFKIQVVDNGRGIDKHDFELIGVRYATSKCHCLGDLGNAKYYGYRGEALASLCEISQELMVVSRAEQEDKTYAKTFRGARRRIDVAPLRRPSCGTTVTVSGFLYNLPVRQAVISGAMELERIRRSLECLAISNPHISFSLRDDASDAWCFRVPKTDSVVTTFSHIFGSVWASTLKPVAGSTPPFSISGFFSLKGHRNKNLQFLYVHKRRIANHHLGEIINQLFGSFLGCNACGISSSPRRGSEADERHPVFMLKIECTAEFYDVGFHPSKTVVEFKKCDVLIELVTSTLTSFLSKNFETATFQTAQQVDNQNSMDLRLEDTMKITAQNYKNSLHSQAAKRAHQPEVNVAVVEDVACKRYSETTAIVNLNNAQMDEFLTPINPGNSPKSNLKSPNCIVNNSASLHVEHLPAEGFGPFSNLSPDLPRPIHLSPALDHKRAALGKFIDVKKRQERIGKAIADLQKFSRKLQDSESKDQKVSDFQNLPTGLPHSKSRSIGTNNAKLTIVNQLPNPINDISIVSSTGLATRASTHFSSTVAFSSQSFFVTSDTVKSINELRLADSEISGSHVVTSPNQRVSCSLKSQENEMLETARSGNISLDIAPQLSTTSYLGADDAQPESQRLPTETSTPALEEPSFHDGCEEALGPKKQWFLGTEPQSKRKIYINGETGHSYYGRPPVSQTPSFATTLVLGHPLPLDTSVSDNQLATSVLPVRPWRSKMPDSGVTGSGGDTREGGEEIRVERMLQLWENPVFKVDPLLKPSLFGQTGDASNISTLGVKPYVFHKDIFENITVIAQVDQKFIVCSVIQNSENGKAPNPQRLLVAFDQHAVHERIRLEALIRDAEYDCDSNRLKTTHLDPPLLLRLPNQVARVCLAHLVGLTSKGIEISACSDTDGDLTPVCINQIPSCLVETGKETSPPTVEASAIENLLYELVETLENTGNFGTEMPKIIVDTLKSQACHGAIKFGDSLSVAACRNLIKMLGQCKLPFFCAHGRPSIVPLFDYNLLNEADIEVKRPKLWKLVNR